MRQKIRTNLIDLLKEEFIIKEVEGRFYITETLGDEITIELMNIDAKLRVRE